MDANRDEVAACAKDFMVKKKYYKSTGEIDELEYVTVSMMRLDDHPNTKARLSQAIEQVSQSDAPNIYSNDEASFICYRLLQ